jgi:integrase
LGCKTFELVLTDLDGHEIDPEALTRRFYSATKRAGLPTIRLHSMRHTWASWALSEGESVHVVAGFLGHSDPGFTLRTYAPFMPNQARTTADRLSSKLQALLENEIGANIGANISQLQVSAELPSSESQ